MLAGDGHPAQATNNQQQLSHQAQYGSNQKNNEVLHQGFY